MRPSSPPTFLGLPPQSLHLSPRPDVPLLLPPQKGGDVVVAMGLPESLGELPIPQGFTRL